jgi:hypothetical protein
VPPEIEDGLRAEAAARGVSVDSVMREALDLYRQQRGNKPAAARRPAFNDRRREIAWTLKPDLKYLGEWVALEGDAVVAHGGDGKAVYESARAQGISSPFLFHVAEPDSTPFAGGWLGVE